MGYQQRKAGLLKFQLLQLWLDDEDAIGSVLMIVVIVLMVVLSGVKLFQWLYLGYDRVVKFLLRVDF